jgi:hypothetical protein
VLGKLFRNAVGKPVGRQAAPDADFLPDYDATYAPLLAQRAAGFRVIFERLQQRCRGLGRPGLIVETGSMRAPGNWAGDGQSTFLWKAFADQFPCEIHTVDLDPEAAVVVNEHCGEPVQAHTGDSVAFLHEMATRPKPPQIDMLYLDSYDYDPHNPFPSAFHHVKELLSVRPCLDQGSIIAIDDNLLMPDGTLSGKGFLATQWFDHLGIECIHRGYQFVWQL